ncbi:unnamed protein product [Anisakis simplex]|uniref:Mucin-5AC n=1 Tax=Anisakis simplex TaxID=6269 RepID=A0A0M3K5X8_ANISI|nr:unnamed protein product [Anisakis simplex]
MILVLDNTGMFQAIPGLYQMTTTRMGSLLPDLLAEVMPGPPRADERLDTPKVPSEQLTPTQSDASLGAVDSGQEAASLVAASSAAVITARTPSPSASSANTASTTFTAVSPPAITSTFPTRTNSSHSVHSTSPIAQLSASISNSRVLIAPPLEKFREHYQQRSDAVKSDVSLHSQSSELTQHQQSQQQQYASAIPTEPVKIPELVRQLASKEGVIIHSGPSSPLQVYKQHHYGASVHPHPSGHPPESVSPIAIQQHQAQAPPHLEYLSHNKSQANQFVDYQSQSQSHQQAVISTPTTIINPHPSTGHLYQTAPPHLIQSQQFYMHSTQQLPNTSLTSSTTPIVPPTTTSLLSNSSPIRSFPIVPSPTSAFSAPHSHSDNDTSNSIENVNAFSRFHGMQVQQQQSIVPQNEHVMSSVVTNTELSSSQSQQHYQPQQRSMPFVNERP